MLPWVLDSLVTSFPSLLLSYVRSGNLLNSPPPSGSTSLSKHPSISVGSYPAVCTASHGDPPLDILVVGELMGPSTQFCLWDWPPNSHCGPVILYWAGWWSKVSSDGELGQGGLPGDLSVHGPCCSLWGSFSNPLYFRLHCWFSVLQLLPPSCSQGLVLQLPPPFPGSSLQGSMVLLAPEVWWNKSV